MTAPNYWGSLIAPDYFPPVGFVCGGIALVATSGSVGGTVQTQQTCPPR
jgi:hypothetical protein